MTTKVKVSPSKLHLISQCPGAALRCTPLPFVENIYASRGKDLHERIELLIQVGYDSFEEITANLDAKDRAAIQTCWDIYQSEILPRGPHIIFTEKKLDLSDLGFPNGGTPDLAVYDIDSGTLVVVDWKFGHGLVPDPQENKQLHAYALGLAKCKELKGKPINRVYLAIVQPANHLDESYRDAMIEWPEFVTCEKDIKKWVADSLVPNPRINPGPWCKSNFCKAGKQGKCPEFSKWANDGMIAKEEKKQAEVESAVLGFNPITVEGPTPAFPLVVLSEEAVARASDLQTRAFALKVTNQETADEAGRLLAEATKFETQVDKMRITVKRPVLDLEEAIDTAAKGALNPLRCAKGELKKSLDDWLREESKRRAAVAAEIEKKRRDDEDRKRIADEAARKAQEKLDNATTEAAKKKALAAQEKARKEQEEANQAVFLPPLVIEEPLKVAGASFTLEPDFTVLDTNAIPREYLVVDMALVKKAVKLYEWGKAGKPCPPWVNVTWSEKSKSSGRG